MKAGSWDFGIWLHSQTAFWLLALTGILLPFVILYALYVCGGVRDSRQQKEMTYVAIATSILGGAYAIAHFYLNRSEVFSAPIGAAVALAFLLLFQRKVGDDKDIEKQSPDMRYLPFWIYHVPFIVGFYSQ